MKLSQLMIFLSAASAITACGPSDQHVKTVRERLEAGEAIEFTKPGTKTANCGRTVWTTIKVSDKLERDRVVLGQQASILNTGYKFCGVIGKPVDMTVFKGDTGLGQVIVNKITLVKLDKLKKSQLKGSFFTADQGFENYKASVRLYPENEGVVTIVDARYQQGSAVDEKAVIKEDAEKRSGDGSEDKTTPPAEIKQLTINARDIKNNDAATSVQGLIDFKEGELVAVNIIEADGSVTKGHAMVLSSVKLKDSTLVSLRLIEGAAK